jgi:transcriptional regulator GlxA family with amidase domain
VKEFYYRLAPVAVKHQGIVMSLRFLSRHWHEPISVADLTGVAGLSRRGFQKAFAQHTGRSPGQELRRLRIAGAMNLLAGSNCEARVIAEMCGFKKLNSFHVAFKQATGLSPQQYRKRLAAASTLPVIGAGWFPPLERNRMGSVPALGTRPVRQLVALDSV